MKFKRGEHVSFTKNIEGEDVVIKGVVTSSRLFDGRHEVMSAQLRKMTGERSAMLEPERLKARNAKG